MNPDGTRHIPFGSPYIDQSELLRNTQLYSPYESFHYGLYDRTPPLCQTWQTHTHQFMKSNNDPAPNAYVDKNANYVRVFNPRGQRTCQ